MRLKKPSFLGRLCALALSPLCLSLVMRYWPLSFIQSNAALIVLYATDRITLITTLSQGNTPNVTYSLATRFTNAQHIVLLVHHRSTQAVTTHTMSSQSLSRSIARPYRYHEPSLGTFDRHHSVTRQDIGRSSQSSERRPTSPACPSFQKNKVPPGVLTRIRVTISTSPMYSILESKLLIDTVALRRLSERFPFCELWPSYTDLA